MTGTKTLVSPGHLTALPEGGGRGTLATLDSRDGAEKVRPTDGELLSDGQLVNAMETAMWMQRTTALIDPVDVFHSIHAIASRVKSGDMSDLESMLVAEAVHLNALFCTFSDSARSLCASDFERAERVLRLGLKCQAQARATAEAVAEMRNPRVFAKQANVVQNGQQQVVNEAEAKSLARKKSSPAKRTIGSTR